MGEVGGSFATFRAILRQINLANGYEQKQCPVIFFGNYINGYSSSSNHVVTNTSDTEHDVYIVLFLIALKALHMDAIHLLRGHFEDFTPRRHAANECNTSSFRSACHELFTRHAGDRV